VLNDDAWIAGDMLADVAREHARIDVVAAAGSVADDQIDPLALVEIGNVVGARRRHGEHERTEPQDTEQPATQATHSHPLHLISAIIGDGPLKDHATRASSRVALVRAQPLLSANSFLR